MSAIGNRNEWLVMAGLLAIGISNAATLEQEFRNPPDAARPGVYWYFMDGNLNREEMTADLESMKEAGLGNLVFLEVNLGIPQGPVKFMSDPWQKLFAHAVHEAERLGIDITLGIGPGWTGSGGPWVKAEESMQHLVYSVTEIEGPKTFDGVLPLPEQRSTTWHKRRDPYYKDVAVYAFPACEPVISDIDEKALYLREPYTSKAGVKPYLPEPSQAGLSAKAGTVIPVRDMVDLTDQMDSEGRLQWAVPEGHWMIMRMGSRFTGAETRPAPQPGLGMECDKFSQEALEHHFDNFIGKLLEQVGPRSNEHGWTTLHMDSWEMGSQNWTQNFVEEFEKRRSYDPRPYLPAFSGRAVESVEITERFLWDVRLTCQELVLDYHARHIKKLGRNHGFELSIEPYDMNPTADLDLGSVADVPMAEFWSVGHYDSSFSCIEASSIAHTMGCSIVSSESFTGRDGWRQYPGSMKNQGDWAFCMGINRFVYHTFAHKPLGEQYRPGMTMGPYGVHWDRGQTWWPLVNDYHRYITRCSHVLRQGTTVSDILYLTPEGAPHVFRPPASAIEGQASLKNKKGYGFDGCSPNILIDRAEVRDGCIVFPGGTSYRLMVLPHVHSMTPRLLAKIESLVKAGAVIIGSPPVKSPSLSDYPHCDDAVQTLAEKLWGGLSTPRTITQRKYGRGAIYWGGILSPPEVSQRPITRSSWIWYPESTPAPAAPVGTRYFRHSFILDKNKTLVSAKASITADNSFTLFINGQIAEQGDTFTTLKEKRIEQYLRPGLNMLAVAATNGGSGPNSAGLIAAFEVNYEDGTCDVLLTDSSWEAGLKEESNWKTLGQTTGKWRPASVLGSFQMSPWRLTAESVSPLYPHYDDTAAVLKKMGIYDDFTSDGSLRYTHRTTTQRDIYFVSNKTPESVQTDCLFRVTGGLPQLWHPVTGEISLLTHYKTKNSVTTIPLEFAPYESYFIVFDRRQSQQDTRNAETADFVRFEPVAELTGAWQAAFDASWGAPQQVVFDALTDWTSSDCEGIKYYSGIAAYRKTFDCPAGSKPGCRFYLELGTVHDMAEINLNGRKLGVLWCSPWRIDISDALRATDNRLEIRVANRWPNRLIGDEQPENKAVRTVQWPNGLLGGKSYPAGRYTFTTSQPYRADSPLLPSGLLGPVKIVRSE
ncbi:MAG: hypothetical protein LLF76_05620 [Planctomycetaceae bacterium]|nr:hypothetical protein [Planctomycetaceae bacterium]